MKKHNSPRRPLLMINRHLIWISALQLLVSFLLYEYSLERVLYINLLVFWALLFLFAYNKRQNGSLLLGFLFTFFVFLLGRDFFCILGNEFYTTREVFSSATVCKIYFLMHLSLTGIFWGWLISPPDIHTIGRPVSYNTRRQLLRKLKYVYYLTLPFQIFTLLVGAYYTLTYGYVTGNIVGEVYHPGAIILRCSQFNFLVFCGYLMLAPEKKELKPILYINTLVMTISVLGGSRGPFLYYLVMVFLYMYSRDCIETQIHTTQETSLFISKKMKITLMAISVPAIIFFNLYAAIRQHNQVESQGVVSDFIGFFMQQGGSHSVIGYTVDNINSFPSKNISYSFGSLVNRIQYGWTSSFDAKTEELATKGNNLGATITWIVAPGYYYAGGGMGTQYIAENYADFGAPGVLLLGVLLGMIISKLTFFAFSNWILQTLLCYALPTVISMPRDFYFTWTQSLMSVPNLLLLLLIYYSTKPQSERSGIVKGV